MKSQLLTFFVLLLSFFFYSCSVKQRKLSLNESKYAIDLDGKKETSIPLSAYFKSAKTIILETKEDCFIGYINELQVFDGCIYVLDAFIASSLFVFDMEGHFIRKIGSRGNGPGEYIQLMDFTIDTENGYIFLLDVGNNRVHKYSLDGTYVQTITPKLQKTNIEFIQYYMGKLYLSARAWQPTSNDYLLLETNPDDGTILSKSLSLEYNKGWTERGTTGHSFFMSRLNAPPLYTHLYMDYIVTVGEEIAPYIELKSKDLVTAEDLLKLPASEPGNEIVYIEARQNLLKIWDVQSLVENDDFISFRYQYGYLNFNTMIYHKATKEVRLVKYLSNDLVLKNDESGFYGRFVFSDKKGAYDVLRTWMIKGLRESIRNNETLPELDKADELLKLDEESNPVIFYYEFK